jgi:hypothetical protein
VPRASRSPSAASTSICMLFTPEQDGAIVTIQTFDMASR